MKTRRIKNKKMNIIYILDLIVLAICVSRTTFIYFIIGVYGALKSFNYEPIIVFLLSFYTVWLYLLLLIFKNFLIIAIYLAYRIPRVRIVKNNSKYEIIENITYYREKFKNITPAEISLLTDLEIERKKDLSASILDLYNRKLINFEGKKIIINNYSNTNLRESEKLLLSMLENKNYDSYNMKLWQDLCIKEAIEDNLIKENKVKPFSRLSIVSKCFIVLLVSLLLGVCYVATPQFQNNYKDKEKFDEIVENLKESEVITLIKTDKDFRDLFLRTYSGAMPLAIIGIIVFTSIAALISMPIYLKVRKITYKIVDKKDKYDRTKEGKILVEQIAGMKNFIHEFSNLSDKEKEAVILWSDFLIYAVLLEENDKIVKDIFNYKKVNTEVLTLVNESVL